MKPNANCLRYSLNCWVSCLNPTYRTISVKIIITSLFIDNQENLYLLLTQIVSCFLIKKPASIARLKTRPLWLPIRFFDAAVIENLFESSAGQEDSRAGRARPFCRRREEEEHSTLAESSHPLRSSYRAHRCK